MWLRVGECNGCGECCKSGDPFRGEEGVSELGADVCPHLRKVDERFRCAVYNTDHHYVLSACSIWPSRPAEIEPYPSCSFSFVEADG